MTSSICGSRSNLRSRSALKLKARSGEAVGEEEVEEVKSFTF